MKIGYSIAPAAGMLALLTLAACGGGGGGGIAAISTPLSDLDEVRALTGSQPPAETVADQAAREPAIIARTDSLIFSTFFGETSHPDLPTIELRASCYGTRCTWREPTTGASLSGSLHDLGGSGGQSRGRTVLTKNGITMWEGRNAESESYGALMQHASFGVASGQATIKGGYRFAGWFGGALGDLTGVQPAMTATWRDLMVGTPRGGALRGNTLQGDASLIYTLSGTGSGALDAAFTDIKDLDRNAAYSRESVRFEGVPVAANGTYNAGLTGNRIQGGFYGPDHAEAAGIFEQGGIVGAFGAKRQ